jgi:uncharacterized membrane protein
MSEETMQVIVAAFPSEEGAKDALKMIKKDKIKRANAAVVSKNEKGKLHIKEQHDWGMGKAAVVGGLASLIIPGVGIVLGAAGGAVLAKLVDAGFPDDTLQHMGRALDSNHSALVVLVDTYDREHVERVMLDAGGQIVSHKLDTETADELAAAYDSATSGAEAAAA